MYNVVHRTALVDGLLVGLFDVRETRPTLRRTSSLMGNNETMATEVTYDTDADVLYVRFEDKDATSGFEDGHGRVWRVGRDNKVIGVTFLDFAKRLRETWPLSR